MLLIAALALLPVLVLLVLVDDWRRDFTTNSAETSSAAADVLLRPLAVVESTADVVRAIREAVATNRRWSWVGSTVEGDFTIVRLVRTTAVFRFKDDITVRIEDRGVDRMISASSRSRIGTGDLGQNPRNLRELVGKLRGRLTGSDVP